MNKLILIFIIFFTLTTNAHALDLDIEESPYVSYEIISYGSAVLGCQYWKDQSVIGVKIDLALDGYLSGFLTSYNVYNAGTKNILGGYPMKTVKKYLDFFCSKYPSQNILKALIVMLDDLEIQRVADGLMIK